MHGKGGCVHEHVTAGSVMSCKCWAVSTALPLFCDWIIRRSIIVSSLYLFGQQDDRF